MQENLIPIEAVPTGSQSAATGAPALRASDLARRPLTMRVFGVGGAGCNALAHVMESGLVGVDCAAINTDEAALARCPVPTKFLLGAALTRGLGAGGDPERGRAAAEEDKEKLSAMCAGADVVLILAGLGGGTGTGASPLLAELARQNGALVLGMALLPFDWEGTRRQRQAQLGLHQLKSAADAVVCLPNQKLLALVADDTGVVEGFAIAHELLARGARGLWRLLTQPGLINVDFADVCAVTRERHAECVLASVEAQGESRAKDLMEALLRHPLMDNGHVLNEASAVLISLAGGPDLSFREINLVMEQINRHCENAHIIMGAAVEEGLSGRLAATLLSSRRASKDKAPVLPGTEPAVPEAPLMDAGFVSPGGENRLAAHYVAPPPSLTPANAEQMLQNLPARARKKAIKMVQGQLPLEIISRGRFEKIEPTIRFGQDLDVPTYLRRNLVFN